MTSSFEAVLNSKYPGWDKGKAHTYIEIGKYGNAPLLDYIYSRNVYPVNKYYILVGAAREGNLDTLIWVLHFMRNDQHDLSNIAYIATNHGHLPVLKEIREYLPMDILPSLTKIAIQYNYTDIIEWCK